MSAEIPREFIRSFAEAAGQASASRMEAFVEMLPVEIGHNRRHYRADIVYHSASADCECRPDEVPHAGPPVDGPARLTLRYVR